MIEQVKVSVIVLTYNHKQYIKQALDSILNQKVNFKYEILIGDDCSTDGSQKILLEYKKKYPDKIKIYLRKKNVGSTRNSAYLIQQAKGQYIANLESDDYWIDEYKLQKQVDFLDANPSYVACAHSCIVVNEESEMIPEKNVFNEKWFWCFANSEYTKKDFEEGHFPGQANALMYRNEISREELYFLCAAHRIIGDRTIVAFLLDKGRIYFEQEPMHAYRLVEKKEADNWQAQSRAANKRYEEYEYICKLEKYANNKLHMNVNLEKVKKEKLICAAVVCLKNPNIENGKVLWSMVKEGHQLLKNGSIVMRTMFLKWYYWNILKEDRPIQI